MTAKQELLQLLQTLPATPTFAEVFDVLRPIYNQEVAPIIAQLHPPRPQDAWRRDIADPAEREEQKTVTANKAAVLDLMQKFLPENDDLAETVNAAAYNLAIIYGVEISRQQRAEGKGTPHEAIKRRYEKWFAQIGQPEPKQTLT